MTLYRLAKKKVGYEVYTKSTKKVHGTQVGHHNCIPIPLSVTELISSISFDDTADVPDFTMLMAR